MKKISSSTKQLEEAIRKLETFSQNASKKRSELKLSKVISLMRALMHQAFDFKREKRESEKAPNSEELLQAVELVNRERLLIQKLEKGNAAEQRLADSFTRAIESYNACCEPHSTKLTAVPKFPPKINLPQKLTVQYLFPAAKSEDHPHSPLEGKKIVNSSVSLPRQAVELFQMKTLALLERYGIAASYEARAEVKQTPVHAELAPNQDQCTLKQTLTLFPGQTVEVMGMSALDPKSRTISKLFPETFSVYLKSTQTGYPDASQRAGWVLGNSLLPPSPQRIDLLAAWLASILQRKKEIIPALQPKGNLVSKAKKLIKLKKEAFVAHQSDLLVLHEKLAQSIVKAAQGDLDPKLEHFYQMLAHVENGFEKLIATNQAISDLFIVKPYQELLESLLKGNAAGGMDFQERQQAAIQILHRVLENAYKETSFKSEKATDSFEKVKWDYILCLGTILGQASKNILLQHLSEDLVFAPPALSLFESKVQTAAYMHVKDFLNELALENFSLDEVSQLLCKQLTDDIALFSSDTPPLLAQEIHSYFQKRYISLSAF